MYAQKIKELTLCVVVIFIMFVLGCSAGGGAGSTSSGDNIYWGDLHIHTMYSRDAFDKGKRMNVDEACGLAKDKGLNFIAVTDHSGNNYMIRWMDENIWAEIVKEINAQDSYDNCAETSEFIPFIGYEWSSQSGHKSVVFKDLDIPWSVVFDTQSFPTPSDLWNALDYAGYDAMTIPHHPGETPTDWAYHNSKYQPVVEIYSKHGSSEYFGADYDPIFNGFPTGMVDYALSTMNIKMGFIAGSDDHNGYVNPKGRVAVFASALSRDLIWDAIKNMRTYATTGAKIILRFSINSYPMGSTVFLNYWAWPTLNISASGDGVPIDRLEVIKNGDGVNPIHTAYFNQHTVNYSWTDRDYRSGDFYYVRVIQSDSERAWSSPIWVETQ